MESREEFILRHSDRKIVIHVGFADWPYTQVRIEGGELLHFKLKEVAKELVGVDVSLEGIKFIKAADPSMELYHVSDEGRYLNRNYDVIVATEVIEHVDNQGEFLEYLSKLSSGSSALVITTPNAYSLKGALRSLVGREYQHPDHLALHSSKTLMALLDKHGWSIKEFKYYLAPGRSFIGRVANSLLLLIGGLFSSRIFDGIMLLAVKRNHANPI